MEQKFVITRRTVLAGIGAGLTLGALSACGSPGGGGKGNLSQPSGNVPSKYKNRQRVVVWTTWGAETGAFMSKLASDFNESQKDVFVDLQSQNGNYDALAQKLAAGLQAKQVPDIALFSEVTWHKFFLNDALEPLDGYFGGDFKTSTYNQQLLNEGKLSGNLWWLPFARSTPLFYYNRDLFQTVGLPDRAPKTWDELRDWSKELNGVTYNASAPKMLAYPKIDGDWMFQGVLWNFDGGISKGLDVTIDSANSIAAGEYQRKLIFDDKMAYMADAPLTDFSNGLIATAEDSTGALKTVVANSKFEVGTGFVPGQKDQVVPTGGGGFSIMAGVPDERKKAAFEFLKYLAKPDVSASWTVATGYLPVVDAAQKEKPFTDLVAQNPNFEVAIKQLPKTRKEDAVRLFVPNANITLYEGLQRIWSKNEHADVVFKDVASDLNKATDKIRAKYEAEVK